MSTENSETSTSDTEHSSPPLNKPTLCHYLAYGIGNIANGWTASVIGFFIFEYFINVQRVSIAKYGAMSIVVQLTNAVNDPLIGVLSDRTKSRFGRRRPFILASAVLMPLCFVLLFSDVGLQTENARYAYVFLMYILFYCAQTLFNVPYIALVMELHDDKKVRNRYIAISAVFFSIGNLIGPVSLNIIKSFVTPMISERFFYIYYSLGSGAIMGLVILVVFFGVRERNIPIRRKTLSKLLSDSLSIMRIPSYICLTFMYISSQIAVQVLQFNMIVYLSYVSKSPNTTVMICLISAILSSILFIYPLHLIIRRFGKKTAFATGMVLFMLPFIYLVAAVPPNNSAGTAIIVVLAILSGSGTATCFYVSSAMLPDVMVQDFLWTRKNREGAMSSFYVFFQKLACGTAHFLVSMIIEHEDKWRYIGDTKDPNQPESIIKAIRYSISVIPLAFIIIALVVCLFYPLTKDVVNQNNEKYIDLMNEITHEGQETVRLEPQNVQLYAANSNGKKYFPYDTNNLSTIAMNSEEVSY